MTYTNHIKNKMYFEMLLSVWEDRAACYYADQLVGSSITELLQAERFSQSGLSAWTDALIVGWARPVKGDCAFIFMSGQIL